MYAKFATLAALVATAAAQQKCSLTTERQPSLSWSTCTGDGQCTSRAGSVTIDSNWRWTHAVSGSTNCYNGNEWDTTICSSPEACTTNCCVDGAEYSATYGITTSGNSLNLKFVTKGQHSTNIGSRTYLMQDENTYQGMHF
jgi:cellulose 1,4-beta-cellobiosidase